MHACCLCPWSAKAFLSVVREAVEELAVEAANEALQDEADTSERMLKR